MLRAAALYSVRHDSISYHAKSLHRNADFLIPLFLKRLDLLRRQLGELDYHCNLHSLIFHCLRDLAILEFTKSANVQHLIPLRHAKDKSAHNEIRDFYAHMALTDERRFAR